MVWIILLRFENVNFENVNLLFNILSTAATSFPGNSFLSRARKKEEPGNELELHRPAIQQIATLVAIHRQTVCLFGVSLTWNNNKKTTCGDKNHRSTLLCI